MWGIEKLENVKKLEDVKNCDFAWISTQGAAISPMKF